LKLVIVESPAKAKTISKILGKEFKVESSIGHIRDLPKNAAEIPAKMKDQKWTRLGVNIEADFEPLYVVSSEKKKQVKKLKDLMKDADEVYLATDEDREGEAISWHLLEILKPKVPVKRLAFHEITKDAILHALDNPRELDMSLVNAQETRRVLDRLYGYEVSPILWKKIAPKLSAGRVQSVALRIIVERERARMRFKAAQYCSIQATFTLDNGREFVATLKEIEDRKIAIGKDFDPDTGKLVDEKKVMRLLMDEAMKLVDQFEKDSWKIESLEKKPVKSSPYAPFITSTLQQDANNKLGFSSRQTMSVAQKLYENGYITYMRTDSITLSKEAIAGARKLIESEYGKEYLPDSPRMFKSKVKNAQEAHEAIRPAGSKFRKPEEISGDLTDEQLKLYDLIYRRTLASQMADAQMESTVIRVTNGNAVFQANGKVVKFPGYLKVYAALTSGKDEDKLLPDVTEGEACEFGNPEINEHATKPPARYTEASLVKELEARGIGRPSTYASIIDTIQRRRYVYKVGKALVPTFVAFAVVRLMEQHFTDLVDMTFTAELEEDLDAISRGEVERLKYLKEFYFGNNDHSGLEKLVTAEIDPKEACTIPVEGSNINVRIGPYGPYLEKDGEKASLPAEIAPDEVNASTVEEILEKGKQADGPMGVEPESGLPIFVKVGRFGPYVQLGEPEEGSKPKMKGLPPGLDVADVDLETAIKIVAMPKEMGVFDKNGETIVADIGRYGPYVKAGSETRSLPKDMNILDLTTEQAIELLNTEKKGRGRAAASALKEFKEDESIKVLNGRYGPYVKQGKVNASVPKDMDVEKMTLEDALKLIADKKAK
jgi:DNA topoisomerase-1